MNDESGWLESISGQAGLLREKLGKKDYKKLRLGLLNCLAERVIEFSGECRQCSDFRDDISALVRDASSITGADRQRRRTYFKSMDRIVGHLQKQHKLVSEGQFLAVGLALGTGIGLALGAAVHSLSMVSYVGIGLAVGAGIGMTIGSALDARARKQGRTLCRTKPDI